jgi:flagellar protein FliL
MSTAAVAEAPAAGKSKKKLIVMIAVAALLLAGLGGGAVFWMKKKAADAEGQADGEDHAATSSAKADPKLAPVFVPLDVFVVNLADRDSERFAQVGVTLEVTDAKTGELIKTVMPAIRNNVLMAIADRTAAELMGRDGKTQLAQKIKRETLLAMGIEVEERTEKAEKADKATNADEADEDKPVKKKKKKRSEASYPVKAVHFSNFIIQ